VRVSAGAGMANCSSASMVAQHPAERLRRGLPVLNQSGGVLASGARPGLGATVLRSHLRFVSLGERATGRM